MTARPLVLALLLAPALAGCAATPRASDRLDITEFTGAWPNAARSLAESSWLAGRTADSPKMVLVQAPLKNLSMERLTRADQAGLVDRLLFAEGVQQLLREKNVRVVVPPDEYARMQKYLTAPHVIVMDDRPTHVLNTTVDSIVRTKGTTSDAGAFGRKDAVSINFTITALQSSEVLWSNRWEFVRRAEGLLAD